MVNIRSELVSNPLKISVFGGGVEKNEKPHETAFREFREETKYEGYLKIYYINKTSNNFLNYYTFLGFANDKVIPDLNSESDGYEYLTYDEILEKPNLHKMFKKFLIDNKDTIYRIINKHLKG